LSFYGTGTISLSGSSVGSLVGTGANNLVSLTFTPSAGSLTLTVTGSVTEWNLEAGAFYTSRIVTTSAAVTRAKDVAKIKNSDFLLNVNNGSFYCVFSVVDTPSLKTILGAGGSLSFWYLFGNERARYTIETSNSAFLDKKNSSCISYDQNGILMVLNGGSVVQGSKLFLFSDDFISIGSMNSGQSALNNGISTLRYYTRKLSASEIQALTS
jgi:hypothetical protein